MQKLVTNVDLDLPDTDYLQGIYLAAESGWEGVFTPWDEDTGNANYLQACRDTGLYYQSVHAPFRDIDRLWEEGERGENEVARQIACIRGCEKIGVPLIVAHAFIGFEKHNPTQIGVDRFGKIFDEAAKCGVKIAMENTEGIEYLRAVLCAFQSHKAIGFCIDTGHEMCYNGRQDLIGEFSSLLTCTHLNDNLGQTSKHITFLDDAHLLPYDGAADWSKIIARLKKANYAGDFTFELMGVNRPDRHTHDKYAHLTPKQFFGLALERAKRFAKDYNA